MYEYICTYNYIHVHTYSIYMYIIHTIFKKNYQSIKKEKQRSHGKNQITCKSKNIRWTSDFLKANYTARQQQNSIFKNYSKYETQVLYANKQSFEYQGYRKTALNIE